jgi:hypothetical protein
MMRSRMFTASTLFTALCASMAAQVPHASAPVAIPGDAPELSAMGGKGMVTVHMEDQDVEAVKGAPFCATSITEHTQTFADGNRIHTSENSNFCRDGEGRTRREASLNLLGAASQASVPKLVTIADPVAGVRYMLDSENKIAHRMAIGPRPGVPGTKAGLGGVPEKGRQVMMYQRLSTAGPHMVVNDDVFFAKAGQPADEPPATTENLGDQTIDGIRATGTRVTTTIPAGKMGNEQPILVTSERWYSPELKATLMTKHNDPWAGELKTQFTNVNTSEPDSSLFVVPGDYKIVDVKAGPLVIQKRVLAPPPSME